LISTSAAPATNFQNVQDVLIDQAEKVASLLSLKDGILHMQYHQSGNDIQVIEFTRRCSGDLYPYPVQYATGLNWGEWIVKAAIGADCGDFPETAQKGFCGRHCVMSSKNGIIKSIQIDNELMQNNVYNSIMLMKAGDSIHNYMTDKAAILFLKYSSKEEMLEKTHEITRLVRLEMC
jgi:hypothetical protein